MDQKAPEGLRAAAAGTWGERGRWALQPGSLHDAPIRVDDDQRGLLGVQAVPNLKGCPTRLEERTALLSQ